MIPDDPSPRRRPPLPPVGWVVAWLLVTVLGVVGGTAAVLAVGDTLRDRGPVGEPVPADAREGQLEPAPGAEVRRELVTEEFGTFVVECRGVAAYGVEARPDEAAGWRTVSFEPGPDDDVDAVFSNGSRSVDLEVYCNRGVPTVAELERNELPDGD